MLSNYSNDIEQRTDEWYAIKHGRFSASFIYKLLIQNKEKTGFGEVAKKYIKSKVSEALGIKQKELKAKSLEWGVYWEPFAKAELSLLYDFIDIGFLEYGKHSGASPDAINNEYVFEIKCPFDFDNHLDNLMIETEEEFKKLRWEYYCQMQWQMNCANKQKGIFYSFYPFMKAKVLEIKRDDKLIEQLNENLEKAIIIKNELINKYNKL